jgi:hypothetical protein
VFLSAEKMGEIDGRNRYRPVMLPSMIEATIGINVSSDARRIPASANAIVRFLEVFGNNPTHDRDVQRFVSGK